MSKERFTEVKKILIRSVEQIDMKRDLPDGFTRPQVIYRVIRPKPAPNYGHEYIKPEKPTDTLGSSNIEQFVKDIIDGNYKAIGEDKKEDKELDIVVSRPSYIILHLDSATKGWWFNNPTKGGIPLGSITLGELTNGHPRPKELYGKLTYVDSSGKSWPDPVKNCQMVYFAAMPVSGTKPNPYTQGLNYNVATSSEEDVIDPDIRHPGNGES